MTGYGRYTEIYEKSKITAEIRTLNSKSFNPYIKIPDVFAEKEPEIKNLIYNSLSGGKINLILTIEDENSKNSGFNKSLLSEYFKEISQITKSAEINVSDDTLLQAVLKLPDLIINYEEISDEKKWETIKRVIEKTLNETDKFRIQEGKALEKDIIEKVKIIETLIPEIETYEHERVETTTNRLKAKLNEFFTGDSRDKERFEQEIIYYLDKFDLNEEKIRLKNHCKYFYETMLLNEPNGTKLGFIAQEMGREINTIGSKANSYEIQKIVVNMKDNLGKIKEQLLNVL